MNLLGMGLNFAERHEDALSVQEAELATLRRAGASAEKLLATQNNLARTLSMLGRSDEAMLLRRDVYSGRLKLSGEETMSTLIAANNYASSLASLKRYGEAKALLRKKIPVARRVLGKDHQLTIKTTWLYAATLYDDPAATLDDLRESVTTLEDADRIARRVLGGAHPNVVDIERELQDARAALRARETPSSPPGSA